MQKNNGFSDFFISIFKYVDRIGPGVKKDEPPKPRHILFLEVFTRRFWHMFKLNIMFLMCCLPVLTIGPALAGFTYVIRNFAREEHSFITEDFVEHSVKNFKQSFIMGILTILIAFSTVYAFIIYSFSEPTFLSYIKYVLVLADLIFIMMNFYIYTMMVTFNLSLFAIIKNAFIFTCINFFKNILLLIICLIPVLIIGIICWYIPPIGIILGVLFLPFTIGFTIIFFTYPTIKNYMLDPLEKQETIE